MNDMISVPLGAVAPGTNAATTLQPGAATNAGAANGTAFQDLLVETIAGTAPKVEAGESWAGQQATEEIAGKSKTEEKSEGSASGADSLLGSIDMASSYIAAAQVIPMVSAPEPQVQAAEVGPASEVNPTNASAMVSAEIQPPQTVSSDTTQPQQSAPANGGQTNQAVSADTSASQEVVSTQETISAQEAAPAQGQPAQTADTVQQPVASDSTSDISESIIPMDAVQTAAVEQIAPQLPDTQVAATDKPAKENAPRTESRSTMDSPTNDAKTPTGTGVSARGGLSLPEVQAPVTANPTSYYLSLRLKMKPDAEVKTEPQTRAGESEKPVSDLAASLLAGSDAQPVRVNAVQDNATTGKVVLGPEGVHVSTAVNPDMMPVEHVNTDKSDAGRDHSNGDFASAIASIRTPSDKPAAGVEHPQAFQAPERVVENKMINQIVQSAKVQMTDGSANMTLRLDPPHLGVLNMNVSAQEGGVVAHIQTSTEMARHALQSDLSSLKQALSDAGITVDSINVSLNTTPDHSGAQLSGSQSDGRNQGSQGNSRFAQGLAGADPAPQVMRTRTQEVIGAFDYLA